LPTGHRPTAPDTTPDGGGQISAMTTRESIVAEQLRLLLKSPFPIYGAAATTMLVVLALRRDVPPAPLFGWAALLFAVQGLRFLLWRRFRRVQPDDARVLAWVWPVTALTTLGGLLWGLLSGAFYTLPDTEMRIFVVFIVTGMMTGGAMSLTAYMPAYYGYLFAATLPILANFVAHGTGTSLLMAGATAIYMAVLVAMARTANHDVRDLIALQLDKTALARDLGRAKEAAEDANRVKSQFLANMSHELRTPLNAIIGFSDVIAKQLFGPIGNPRYRDYVADINNSGCHLLRLVNDILDLSKLEAGAFVLSDGLVDLGQIVADCVSLMRPQAEESQLALAVEMPTVLPPLRADELRLKQVLLNLLANAVKFSRPGGRVAIVVGVAAGGGLVVTVSDGGIGMDVEEVEIALQPFRQVESSANRRFAGTGLGLPLAKSLVEKHGGTLHVDSKRDAGTTVTVTLPAWRVTAMIPPPLRLATR
jgi:signal transduction histidine kinase